MFNRAPSGVIRHLAVRFSACLALFLLGMGAVGAQTAAPAPAGAAPSAASPVQVVLEQFKVQRDAKGQESLVAADYVRPSDLIEYRATYRNVSQAPVKGLVASLPVPEGVSYVPRSSLPGGAVVATRDARFAPEPLKRSEPGADGKPRLVDVPYSEYRSIRWSLGAIEPGREVRVSARVQVQRLSTAEEIASASKAQQAISAAKAAAGVPR